MTEKIFTEEDIEKAIEIEVQELRRNLNDGYAPIFQLYSSPKGKTRVGMNNKILTPKTAAKFIRQIADELDSQEVQQDEKRK